MLVLWRKRKQHGECPGGRESSVFEPEEASLGGWRLRADLRSSGFQTWLLSCPCTYNLPPGEGVMVKAQNPRLRGLWNFRSMGSRYKSQLIQKSRKLIYPECLLGHPTSQVGRKSILISLFSSPALLSHTHTHTCVCIFPVVVSQCEGVSGPLGLHRPRDRFIFWYLPRSTFGFLRTVWGHVDPRN